MICLHQAANAQVKILFDAKKAESAANADWVIDADSRNLDWNPGPVLKSTNTWEANAQRVPNPAQSLITATTSETFWDGGLSYWAIDCVRKGYTVETLPYNGTITFGNSTNIQDLSNYKIFIVCEPNILFTAAEKTAILSFVNAGGSLFVIADHNVSDRNGDSFDSPHIWNDLFQNNSTGNTNPFGFIFDYVDTSVTSTRLASLPLTDTIVYGSFGAFTKIKWSGGTTMTISPSVNPSVKAVFYSKAPTSGNNNVMVAYARYGKGKVVAFGDSSPFDDGTGDSGDVLYNGYTGDVPTPTLNHRNMIMNSTIWLAMYDTACSVNYWTGAVSKAWENPYNWGCGTIPGPNTVVYIDANKPNYPEVNSLAICKTLYTAPTVTVKVNTGFKLDIVGK